MNDTFEIRLNGEVVEVKNGQTIATVLLSNGYSICRETVKNREARGIFCGMGQCWECIMVVNGQPNVRACMTLAEPNMNVETQKGLGPEADR